NVLILDEPTNHLDLKTKGVLKEALRNFEGTVICVSHDRDFLNGLVDKVYEFADHQVKEFLGGIADFLEAKKISCFREYEMRHSAKKSVAAVEQNAVAPSANKLGFEERKQLNKEVRKAEQRVSKVESDIESCELKIAELEEQMANGASDESIFKAYGAAKQELENFMEEWESANAELEERRSKLD
ncbi:MAG: ABC-F family ATP-binding cassette domain-containing protein, partial [Odoribacter sp.]|nr:ABC-F family ATP-binding cassette domain-containing protein [Odoribacter sp.]